MTAGRAVEWIYDHLTRGLPDEAVDRIDAYLGDDLARARVRKRNRETVIAAGVEVG